MSRFCFIKLKLCSLCVSAGSLQHRERSWKLIEFWKTHWPSPVHWFSQHILSQWLTVASDQMKAPLQHLYHQLTKRERGGGMINLHKSCNYWHRCNCLFRSKNTPDSENAVCAHLYRVFMWFHAVSSFSHKDVFPLKVDAHVQPGCSVFVVSHCPL